MPKKLLLADDSVTIQKMVVTALAGDDLTLVVVDNGEDAVARARELRPDLILADVVMPRRNGYDVCLAIKSDPILQDTPVVLLAGAFEAFDEARSRAVRADSHIAKPFHPETLRLQIEELLSGRPTSPPGSAAGHRSQDRHDVPSTPAAPARTAPEPQPEHPVVLEKASPGGAVESADSAPTSVPGNAGRDAGSVPGSGVAAVPAPPAADLNTLELRALVERLAREIIPPLVDQAVRERVERLLGERD